MAISNPVVNSNEVANAFRMPLDNIGIGLQNYTQNALINAERQAQKQAQMAAQRDRLLANLIPEDAIVTGTAYDNYLRQEDEKDINGVRDYLMKNPNAPDAQQQAAIAAQRMQGRRQAAKGAVAGVQQWSTGLGKEYAFIDPTRTQNAGMQALLFDEKGQPRPYTDLNYNYQGILPGNPTSNPEQWAAVANRAQLPTILRKNLGDAFQTEQTLIPNPMDNGQTDLKLTGRPNLQYDLATNQFVTKAEEVAFDVANANGNIPSVMKGKERVLSADVYDRVSSMPEFKIQTDMYRRQRAQADPRGFGKLPAEVQERKAALDVLEEFGPKGGTKIDIDRDRYNIERQAKIDQQNANQLAYQNQLAARRLNLAEQANNRANQKAMKGMMDDYTSVPNLVTRAYGSGDAEAKKMLQRNTTTLNILGGKFPFVNLSEKGGKLLTDPNTGEKAQVFFEQHPGYGNVTVVQSMVPELDADNKPTKRLIPGPRRVIYDDPNAVIGQVVPGAIPEEPGLEFGNAVGVMESFYPQFSKKQYESNDMNNDGYNDNP